MKAISLFSSAGIGELRLHKKKIDFVLANELITPRAKCYSFFYPQTRMINGDITDPKVKAEIIDTANSQKVKLLLATPPCQGLSTLGKNKVQEQYIHDRRNFLILEVLDIIDAADFDYILIHSDGKGKNADLALRFHQFSFCFPGNRYFTSCASWPLRRSSGAWSRPSCCRAFCFRKNGCRNARQSCCW